MNKSKNDKQTSRYSVTNVLMAPTTKQATLSFDIIISIWLFHVTVLSVINPKYLY